MKKINLGSESHVSLSEPSIYSMFFYNDDILISKPRFDTLFRFKDFKVQPIWQNIYKTNYDDNLSFQKVQNARLVYYSDSSILMIKSIHEITRSANQSRGINRDAQLLFLDRKNNTVQTINKLYFKDKKMNIEFSPDIQLNNDMFCIALKAKDVVKLINDKVIDNSISEMIIKDAPRTNKPINDFDNPLLLIGQFK